MASRPRHTNPHVEATLAAAEERGWRVEKAAGGHAHVWGRMLCPQATREGCIVFVHSPHGTRSRTPAISRNGWTAARTRRTAIKEKSHEGKANV